MAKISKLSQLPGPNTVSIKINTLAATVSDEVLVWANETGSNVKITQIGFCPATVVTGAATNNMALQFKSKTTAGAAGANITAVRTYASGTNIAVFDTDNLVLSTTEADLQVDAGEVITLDKTENGTGLALPEGIAVVQFEFV